MQWFLFIYLFIYVIFMWYLCDIHVIFMWYSRDICVIFMWYSRDICVIFMWCSRDIYVIFIHLFTLLYVFFWVIPRSLNFVGRCFVTLCSIFIGRYSSHLPAYEDGTECSETSEYKIQTPGNYPEENIQHSQDGKSLKSRIYLLIYFLFFILHRTGPLEWAYNANVYSKFTGLPVLSLGYII
jgi:hypothetical protein